MPYENRDAVPESMRPALLEHLLAQWRFIALACITALSIAAVAALVLPNKYTAVSRVVIDPPAGSDPRSATVVSPIYLESLRSYEFYASSDDLFLRAAKKFGLRRGAEPIEKLKDSVLKVDIPRSTKVLEISVRWSDPKISHALALYLAEETVKLSQSVGRAGEADLTSEFERQVAEARARLARADNAALEMARRGSLDRLKQQLETDEQLRGKVKQFYLAEGEASDPSSRLLMERYRKQLDDLEREIGSSAKQLAEFAAANTAVEAERGASQAALRTAETQLAEARLAQGYRGERLRMLDPGIVPERPSSPNVPLIFAVAVLGALVLSAGWVLLASAPASSPQPLSHSVRRELSEEEEPEGGRPAAWGASPRERMRK